MTAVRLAAVVLAVIVLAAVFEVSGFGPAIAALGLWFLGALYESARNR